MLVDSQCPLCHASGESILHALHDCEVVKQVWYQLGMNHGSNYFFSSNLNGTHQPEDTSRRALELHFFASPYKEAITRVCIPVYWSKLAYGWVKLNTNRSSLGNPSIAGGGGLIRDEEGKWIVGFARKIRMTTSFLAELWALCDGLNVCLNYNFAAVEVELDAKAIVEAIANLYYTNVFVFALMEDCRLLVSQIP
ncbi:uncharacterized protein LOC136063724 [Quercus suber]|uniref:uncharacterized protein LOC136063724 n=1 Tax=Quercus suber TaxID=58331 RepID=UPI0032DE5DD4